MIGASRRQDGRSSEGTFTLHSRVARGASWHRRLLHASFAALAAALVSLVLPLGLTARIGMVVAAALIGAAWPLRGRDAAALRGIREQTGLSYETALTLLERRDDEGRAAADPYGFEEAVLERAREAVRSYQHESRPPWWLPALLVAAVLVALPVVAPASVRGSASGSVSAAGGGTEAEPSEPAGASEPEAPEPPAPGRSDAPVTPPDQDGQPDAPPVAEPPEGGSGNDAPLSRYLDSLRERTAPEGGAPDQGQGADEGSEESQRDTGGAPEGDPGEGAEPGGDRTASQEDSSGGGAEEQGAESQQEGAEAESEAEVGNSEEGGSETGVGLEPRAAEEGEEQGSGEQLDEGGQEGAEGGEPGEGSSSGTGEGAEGQEGADSAGIGGGSDATVDDSEAQPGTGEPEQLPGVVQEGPESIAGSVRLPGSDEVQLPAGTSFAPYQGAAEEALSEGDIPLDYQEIIRRYFR